jgi:starch synthase
MTSLIPMYLKTTYKNDPIFKNTKTVFTVYDNVLTHKFNADLIDKVKMIDIEESMLANLESGDLEGFIKIGIEYADIVIKAQEAFTNGLNECFSELPEEKKVDISEKNGDYLDSYYNLYNELVG